MNAIFNRRSIRKYEDKPVESKKIEQLLRASMQAPSAGNQQPWEYIVVEDKETLQALSLVSPYAKMVAQAPLAIVFLTRCKTAKFLGCVPQDMGAAVENLLLEAVELDLGAVWLGIAPVQEKMDGIKELFNLPDTLEPFALVPVGYPAGEENKFVDRFDATRVHYEKLN